MEDSVFSGIVVRLFHFIFCAFEMLSNTREKSTRDRDGSHSSSDSMSTILSALPRLYTQTSFSPISPSISQAINITHSNTSLDALNNEKFNNLHQALRERASCDAILEIIRLSPNSCTEVSDCNGYLPHHISAGKDHNFYEILWWLIPLFIF